MGEMMPEFEFELEGLVTQDVQLEFYLRGRETPVQVFCAFSLTLAAFDDDDDDDILTTFMDYCEMSLLNVLDTRGEERFVFTDSRKNKIVVMTAEVQSVSILAPDRESLAEAIASTDS